MPVMRSYLCPDCGGVFDHLHMNRNEPPPDECPLCGAYMGVDTEPEIRAPHVAKPIGKIADNVYRQMETGSEQRAAMAAEHLGVDASEMSAMKITDMADNTREGESAAKVSANPVSQFMGQTGVGGMTNAASSAQYAQATRTGPYAGMGNSTRQNILSRHSALAQSVAAKGNLGRDG